MPGSAQPLDGLDDLVAEFVVEGHETLDGLDRDLLALELLPDSPDALAAVFRAVHSLKGTGGLLGLSRLERLCHLTESVLARVRDGALRAAPEVVDALLRSLDLVRALLAAVEATGDDDGVDTTDVERELTGWLSRPTQVAAPPRLGDVLVAAGKATAEQVAAALAAQAKGDQRFLGQILVEDAGLRQEDVDGVLALQGRGGLAESTARVDLAVLDRLADVTDRLAQVVADVEAYVDTAPALQRTSRQLALLTAELQAGLRQTRRQTLDTLWSRLPRLVRDVAGRTDKVVRLETSGGATSVDRSLAEALKDPLTHLVRNAVDHGIECPQLRVAAGKPAEGVVSLLASDDGDDVVVEVTDDGAGLDLDRLGAHAVERGLLTPERLVSLTSEEVADLTFLSGLSLAEAVTEVSGRGVGMDVVRRNIEAVGGRVTLHSRPGLGTTVRVVLPRRRAHSAEAAR